MTQLKIRLTNHATVKLPWNLGQLAEALRGVAADMNNSPWGAHATVSSTATMFDAELAILDDSDQAGALGYHDVDPAGKPYGRVFLKTDLADGLSPSVTASHEFEEMVVDLMARAGDQVGATTWVAHEVSDPVEADDDGYKRNGLQVSNFILPAWFDPSAPPPYDHLGLLSKPLTLRPGGYMAVWTPRGWTQKFARDVDGQPSKRLERARRIVRRAEQVHTPVASFMAGRPVVELEEVAVGASVVADTPPQ